MIFHILFQKLYLLTGLGDTKSTFCCLPKKNKSSQIFSMINEMATQEKEMKDQIQVLIEREKNYDSVLKNFQKMIKKPSCCCPSTQDADPRSEIEKISQELKIENGILKSEMMELKLELKHCLEKVEGPMKQRLETERSKCIQLQKNLNETSENMISNQDVYLREMNSLKMQLCAACSNMTELSTINKRLKNELDALDCMCTKLEDDLVKQKLSEAETIKRLKKRLPVKIVGELFRYLYDYCSTKNDSQPSYETIYYPFKSTKLLHHTTRYKLYPLKVL